MPREQITIGGTAYNVPLRYEDGHVLTSGEAAALNQTLHEHVRNNLTKEAKAGTLTQARVDEYAAAYQFGIRSRSGTPPDPVTEMAIKLTKATILDNLKAQGKITKASDVDAKALTEAAKASITPEIMEIAKQRVAQEQSLAAVNLGVDLPVAVKPVA